MKFLIDTSAVINIIQQRSEDALYFLQDQITLDLAFYEAGNVIRTMFHRGDLDRTDALNLGSDLADVWKLMNVVNYSSLDMNNILDLALDLDIAFYDAAFLVQSRELDIPFVTDDQPLQKKIPKSLSWMSSDEYILKLTVPDE